MKILSLAKVLRSLTECKYVFTRDLIVVISSILTKKKVIYEIHKKTSRLNILIFKFFKNRFSICAISNGIHDYCINILGFKNENIFTLHDAVDFDSYNNLLPKREKIRVRLNMDSNIVYAFYSGTVGPGRDMYSLIKLSHYYKNVIFYIAGDDGNKFKEILNLNSIPANLIFLGYLNKDCVLNYQVGSDILLNLIDSSHPNVNFCSQLKIFEYYATGNVVISPNIGSLSEVVNTERCFIYNKNLKLGHSNIIEIFENCLNYLKHSYPRMPNNIEFSRINTWEKRAKDILQHF